LKSMLYYRHSPPKFYSQGLETSMAIPFNYESQQPSEPHDAPMKIGAAMQEVFNTLMHHNVVKPIQELCTRNDAVGLSTACIRPDHAQENAYADYA
jgi:hypothetical protein